MVAIYSALAAPALALRASTRSALAAFALAIAELICWPTFCTASRTGRGRFGAAGA